MRFGMILIVKNPDFYAYSCFMITHSAVFKMHSFGTIWVGCCHLRLGKSAKKKWKKTFSWNIKSLIQVYNQNHVLVLGTETKVQFHYPISSYTGGPQLVRFQLVWFPLVQIFRLISKIRTWEGGKFWKAWNWTQMII